MCADSALIRQYTLWARPPYKIYNNIQLYYDNKNRRPPGPFARAFKVGNIILLYYRAFACRVFVLLDERSVAAFYTGRYFLNTAHHNQSVLIFLKSIGVFKKNIFFLSIYYYNEIVFSAMFVEFFA